MPKASTVFVCQQCGSQSSKWAGRCAGCGEWNSLVETPVVAVPKSSKQKKFSPLQITRLNQIKPTALARQTTCISELDRVLGGGLVPGQVVLVAGEPGIGKSTLLTQLALRLSSLSAPDAAGAGLAPILYISGEESVNQVSLRVNRLSGSHSQSSSLSHSAGAKRSQSVRNDIKNLNSSAARSSGKAGDSFLLASQTDVDVINSEILARKRLSLVIIDSIQTLNTSDLSGMAGSVGQVRESASRLIDTAKKTHTPLLLVGHVTKEGAIAGPRVLEHLVDTVLWFEGDRYGHLRLLRAVKNRFGPTDEVGVFQMTAAGLVQVTNPSKFFLDHHSSTQKSQPGSAVAVVMEGLRPLLAEIQALVVPSQLAIPRRVAKGIDLSRLHVIVAVLIKRTGLRLGKQDIYVNVAGGLKLKEPAADLAVAVAVFSAYQNQPIREGLVFAGEVGLLGEVRSVPQFDKRKKEAQRLGFPQLLGPAAVDLRQILKSAIS